MDKGTIQDWDSLAVEVRLIWDNAKEYNQEGSDIYMMAEKLEASNLTSEHLQQWANASVQSWAENRLQSLGAQPRRNLNLKLSLSQPKPKALRLTMASTTPTPTVVGGTIDNESLRRQKEEMGQALSKVQRANSKVNGSTPVPSSAAPSIRRSASLATERADTVMTDVNGTNTSTPQPQDAARASQPPIAGQAQLPTPVQELATAAVPAAPLTNGTSQHAPALSPTQTGPQSHLNQSVIPMERRLRDPGKGMFLNLFSHCFSSKHHLGLESALLHSVTFKTNPLHPPDPKWKLYRFASPTLTQTSGFIALPPSYRSLLITPNLTPETHSRRRHRVLFTHNSTVYKTPNSTTVPGAFEVKLVPGQNVLSVEVLADLKQGERKEYAPPQLQFDFEKCTMIVDLNMTMGQ